MMTTIPHPELLVHSGTVFAMQMWRLTSMAPQCPAFTDIQELLSVAICCKVSSLLGTCDSRLLPLSH